MKHLLTAIFALTVLSAWAHGQNQRDIAVREDKQELINDESWIYDNLEVAFQEAARTNRPLMIVFR